MVCSSERDQPAKRFHQQSWATRRELLASECFPAASFFLKRLNRFFVFLVSSLPFCVLPVL